MAEGDPGEPAGERAARVRLHGDLLYLDRYWLEEQQVCNDVHAMIAVKPQALSPDIDRLFPAATTSSGRRRKWRCRRA